MKYNPLPIFAIYCKEFFNVGFPVLTAVTKKNEVLWDVTSCEPCNDRRFGGMCLLHHQSEKNTRVRTLLDVD
jgi:hypothetical protein